MRILFKLAGTDPHASHFLPCWVQEMPAEGSRSDEGNPIQAVLHTPVEYYIEDL